MFRTNRNFYALEPFFVLGDLAKLERLSVEYPALKPLVKYL